MLSRILSASLIGIDAHAVEVEVDITSKGLPHFSTVGLPDTAVKESKDRVRAALKNTGFNFPLKQITVNLAPADIKKEGSAFDLPIAIGITVAEGIIEPDAVKGYLLSGELSLDGRIKPVRGALSMAIKARDDKVKGLILPQQNAKEAAVVDGITVYGFESLPELIEFFRGIRAVEPVYVDLSSVMKESSVYQDDFSDVKGQEHVKRAIEVAASGGHNMLMIGPPGSGKTMLARRIPTILPEMTFEEALQTTRIHSATGLLNHGQSLVATRPFRSPHHTLSDVAMVGGGTVPKPGEVSLTHNGILFLDELPEFKRNVLEVLRQPLEDGSVTISRALTSITYPASIMLVCAMNPCPCGYLGDSRHQCSCSPSQIQRYRQRVSGPLLDRIDIHIEVPAVPYKDLSQDYSVEPSKNIRARLRDAKKIQIERFNKENLYSNAKMRSKHIKKYCVLQTEAQSIIESAMHKLGLSARAYTRILKVSRTIADLAESEQINAEHISEAIQYRTLDRGMV
ncbi:MAG TPA: ATP-binding protein [Nitrospirae bacterium]|nr:competence protein ComM [bacterium BMS3Abin06]HDH11613.1 ATP-binding protein [Nitrospirota bacterium]HDZ02033.1 ATP-binding protein [Nitrospirota bacterium]